MFYVQLAVLFKNLRHTLLPRVESVARVGVSRCQGREIFVKASSAPEKAGIGSGWEGLPVQPVQPVQASSAGC